MKFLLLIGCLAALSGCTSHYASLGKIEGDNSWKAFNPAPSEDTNVVLENDGKAELAIQITPCNNRDRYVPPLGYVGTTPSKKEPHFVIGFGIYPIGNEYELSPSDIKLGGLGKKELTPLSISVGQKLCNIDVEYVIRKKLSGSKEVTHVGPGLRKRKWLSTEEMGAENFFDVRGETLEFSVMFDIPAPSIETEFYLTLDLYKDGRLIQMPKIMFTKGLHAMDSPLLIFPH